MSPDPKRSAWRQNTPCPGEKLYPDGQYTTATSDRSYGGIPDTARSRDLIWDYDR
jgi:hypothetical protein